ncbi:phage baseplate plug family protein, partial [Klebsiella pneumoniae]
MQEISLSPSLSQKVYVTLGGQNCAIKLHQRSTGFYADLYVDDKPIFQG